MDTKEAVERIMLLVLRMEKVVVLVVVLVAITGMEIRIGHLHLDIFVIGAATKVCHARHCHSHIRDLNVEL